MGTSYLQIGLIYERRVNKMGRTAQQVATAFHSNRYKSIHECDQSNLARDTDIFACFVEALLPPSHTPLCLQHPAPFLSLLCLQ
jgi:hypothetical protein